MTDNRDVGLDFGQLLEDLEGETYPLSNEALLERYGDREIGTENGTQSLQSLLGPLDDQTYDGPDAIQQTVLTMVGEGAEGRTEYSDRGTRSTERDDQQSL